MLCTQSKMVLMQKSKAYWIGVVVNGTKDSIDQRRAVVCPDIWQVYKLLECKSSPVIEDL